jgi:hypothetical protein
LDPARQDQQAYPTREGLARHLRFGRELEALSAIAGKITGTAWSGPLFFGLKPNLAALDA